MKNTFFVFFHAKIQSLVSETQHLRILFWILDPLGMSGVRNPIFTNYFWDLGPFWGVWCQKPNIYELFWGFGTLFEMYGVRNPTFMNYFWDLGPFLGCLVSETQHL